MNADDFTFESEDGLSIFVHRWLPEGEPRAIVQIAHGMAEHSARYERVARALTGAGLAVYANDHRGHGRSAPTEADLGHMADEGGWDLAFNDVVRLHRLIGERHPGAQRLLIGHSMGSFLVQRFLFTHGGDLAGAALSGSNGHPGPILKLGKLVCRIERRRVSRRRPSPILQMMSFGDFNKPFKPNRTEYDWLSRDDVEVDKYIADPWCGFAVTTQCWYDMLAGFAALADPTNIRRIPSDLPVHVFSGSDDPVSQQTKSLEGLLELYRGAGLTRLTHKFYPGGRHEMFNETNRDEVLRDLIDWIDGAL